MRRKTLVRTALAIAIVAACTDTMPTAPRPWINLTNNYDAVAGQLKVCNFGHNASKTYEITFAGSSDTVVSTVPLDQCDIVWESTSLATVTASIKQQPDSLSYIARTLLYITGEQLVRSDFPDRTLPVSVSGDRGASIHFKNEVIGSAVGMSGGLPGSVRACNLGPRTEARIVLTSAPSGVVTSPVTIPDEECVVVWRRAEGSADTVPVTVTQRSKEIARVAKYVVNWSHQQADTVVDPALATITLDGSEAFGAAIYFDNDEAVNANWPIRGHVKACNFPAPGIQTTATRVFDVQADRGIVWTPDTLVAYECGIVWQATDTVPTKVVVSRRPLAGYSMPYLLRQVWNGADQRVDHPTSERDSVFVSSTSGYSIYFKAEPSASGGVPAVAPESIPSWVVADSLIAQSRFGPYRRRLLYVLFDADADSTSRALAVNSVSGTVVGGHRGFGNDGHYLVQVAADSLAAIAAAANTLRASGVTDAVMPAMLNGLESSYSLPNDPGGAAFVGYGSWKLDAMKADGPNWALEAIAAPMAWGCSIGDTSTVVAILDRGFNLDDVQDLPSNHRLHRFTNAESVEHGTRVASIAVATGNNDRLISGVMWQSKPAFVEWNAHPVRLDRRPEIIEHLPNATEHLYQIGLTGAKVINLSMNLPWETLPSESDSVARSLRQAAREMVSSALERLARQNHRPLIVISAGNYGIDARWGGTTEAKLDYPNQVLVVGAMNDEQDGRWVGGILPSGVERSSNSGSLIDLYAPGENVAVLTENGGATLVGGTSYAAPLATGTAGLLAAFDPRIPSDGLKALIIQGALRDGRRIEGTPVLNAYQALRVAAEAEGAPLCGNRIWSNAGGIVVERVRSDPSSDEVILPQGSFFSLDRLNPLHGGSVIRMEGVSFPWLFRHRNGTWNQTFDTWHEDAVRDNGNDGGTANSAWSVSHGGDSSVAVTPVQTDSTIRFIVRLRNREGQLLKELGTTPTFRRGIAGPIVCVEQRDGACTWHTGRAPTFGTWNVTPLAYGPGRALLAITRVHESVTVEGWIPCPVEGPKECRRVHFNADPVETIIFEFPFESVPAEFQVRTGIRVGTVAVSESGAEWLVTETSGPRVTSYTPGIRTLSDGSERLTWGPGGVSYQGGCSLIYRPSPWGTESPAGRTIPLATDECSGRRGGTIAPSIMAIDP